MAASRQEREDQRATNFATRRFRAFVGSPEYIRSKQATYFQRDGRSWLIKATICLMLKELLDDATDREALLNSYLLFAMANFLDWDGKDGSELRARGFKIMNTMNVDELRRKGMEPI